MGAIDDLSENDTRNVVDARAADCVSIKRRSLRPKPLVGAYVALLLFMVIYCSRPEDWIPSLSRVPLEKITAFLALLALAFSLRQMRQRLPRETFFLALLIGQLFLSAELSPVWRGGAFKVTLDFGKVLLIVLVIIAAVRTSQRLRILIFTQAVSVLVIATVALWKGRLVSGRLEGVLGGYYSDPNDMALAIVISLPLCLALLFLSRNLFWKTFWAISILVMTYALFLTGSRGGFLALVVAVAVSLWEFAIRGRRRYLLALAALAGVIFWQFSGGVLVGRLKGTFDAQEDTAAANASALARQSLFWRSIEVTKEHPFFGVGPGNFDAVSGQWHTTHNSLTLMSAEGGVPAFILYVLILWCGFKNLSAAKRLARGRTRLRFLAQALLASLAGCAMGSVFLSVGYAFFPYILVAYSAALLSITRESAAQSRKSESARQAATEGQHVTAAEEGS
jgi:putative inorganic carbon (hco3(-)) transporter